MQSVTQSRRNNWTDLTRFLINIEYVLSYFFVYYFYGGEWNKAIICLMYDVSSVTWKVKLTLISYNFTDVLRSGFRESELAAEIFDGIFKVTSIFESYGIYNILILFSIERNVLNIKYVYCRAQARVIGVELVPMGIWRFSCKTPIKNARNLITGRDSRKSF